MKIDKGKAIVIILGIVAAGVAAYAFVPQVRNLVSKATGGKIGGDSKHARSYAAMPLNRVMMPPRMSPSMQAHEPNAPGGSARNTLPGMLNTSKWNAKMLNRYGR